MSIPTHADILESLDRLDHVVADDLETDCLEFKPWSSARDRTTSSARSAHVAQACTTCSQAKLPGRMSKF